VSTTSNPLGSYSFFAIMHELGHAMGLSHPGDYNAGPGVSITYANSAQFVQDSEQYSVMSYFGGSVTGESPGNFATAETPMMFDIYELQQLYGANMTTRTGDTVYGFGSNAGTVYDFAQNAQANFCIWDAGGVDTLNCSGYGQNQLINLNAGTFSNVGGATGNVSIALNVTMENAVGGSGNDTIIGNAVANRLTGGNGADNITGGDGNDILIGGAGNDTLDGGNGTDQAVFAGLRSAYTLTDLGNGSVRVVGPDGTDTLSNIEQLVFNDQTVTWPLNQTSGSVTLSNVTASIAENTSTATHIKVADITTSGSGTLGLSGADAAAFELVGNALYVKSGTVLDFEAKTSYAVTVTLTSGGATVASAGYTLAVGDLNDNAPVVTTNATQTVAENATVVAALTSTDVDTVGTKPATFSITGGANAALFNIVGGNLVFKTAPDYETGAHSYQVQVSASDGVNTTAKMITVNVTDVNDNAAVITTASTLSVATNTTVVAALTSTDADTVGTNPVTFTISGGANAALFNVVGGNLVFRKAPNYATDPHTYQVQVSASDGVHTTVKTLTVNLTNASGSNNAAPVITTAATQTIAENKTVVAALTSTDADAGSPPATFTITGGANAALFSVVAGNLVFKIAPDYDTGPHSYQVQVSASDGVHTTAKTITVNVTDVNDNAPVITTAATKSIPENTTLVAALTSTDVDTVGTKPATFTITGGANAGLFNIVGGNLVFKTAPDYETNPHTYQVQVSATDGVFTTSKTITVNVTNVNETSGGGGHGSRFGADTANTSSVSPSAPQDVSSKAGTSALSAAISDQSHTTADNSDGDHPGSWAGALAADHFPFDPALGTTGSIEPAAAFNHASAGAIDLDQFVFAALSPPPMNGSLDVGDLHAVTDSLSHATAAVDQVLANLTAWAQTNDLHSAVVALHDAVQNHHLPEISHLLHV
jgi:hypothetical protein